MPNNIVKLKWPEVFQGAFCGVMRRVISKQRGYCDKSKDGTSGWANDIIGALGEIAFAKYANFYCSHSVNSFKLPDVCHIQVRSTNCQNGHLIVQENDNNDDPYVLMIGEYEEWTIAGWISGGQAKQIGIKKSENTYWVPIDELEDISTLPKKPQ